jgi:purine nucleoside permease
MVLLAVKNEIKANDATKTARFMYRADNGNAYPTVTKIETANLATIYHGYLKLVFFFTYTQIGTKRKFNQRLPFR